jgi:hypothetical protein
MQARRQLLAPENRPAVQHVWQRQIANFGGGDAIFGVAPGRPAPVVSRASASPLVACELQTLAANDRLRNRAAGTS